MKSFQAIKNGILNENPTFRLVLGMCPTLAVTTTAVNGLGMGLATAFVMIWSNILTSMLKNVIPDKVRIPCYIVIIAAFTSIVDMSMAAILPDLHRVLGIFIPLIVANCIPLARLESYASKNPIIPSAADGLGMGLGFSISLTILGAIRELLGSGKIFAASDFGFAGITLFNGDHAALAFILPPGAFLTLGLLFALINKFVKSKPPANPHHVS